MTVPVVVAHPVSVTLPLHVTVVVQNRGAHTLEVPADLSSITFGAFIHHSWVRDIRAQLEIYTPARGASNGSLDNSRLNSKNRHSFHIFTLQLPTHGIPAGTFLVVMAMETTVAKSVTLGIHFSKTNVGGCFGF